MDPYTIYEFTIDAGTVGGNVSWSWDYPIILHRVTYFMNALTIPAGEYVYGQVYINPPTLGSINYYVSAHTMNADTNCRNYHHQTNLQLRIPENSTLNLWDLNSGGSFRVLKIWLLTERQVTGIQNLPGEFQEQPKECGFVDFVFGRCHG